MCNKTPHKHAALIKAWADGATIQYKVRQGEWRDVYDNDPTWNDWEEYRVKPEPKPDIERFIRVEIVERSVCLIHPSDGDRNLKLTFDGETGAFCWFIIRKTIIISLSIVKFILNI